MAKPTAKDLAAATFNGRPVAHQDHLADIERRAAVHEFEGKLPRSEAEDRAYSDYLKDPKDGQHVLAAAHHLAGMKAAYAAGDLEAARNHSVMYNLHSRALGHEPVGPAHPAVAAQLAAAPPRVYKFKAHPGDLFAVEKPAEQAAPDLGKALHKVYEAFAPLTKAERKWIPVKDGRLCAAKTGKGLTKCQNKATMTSGSGRHYCNKHLPQDAHPAQEQEDVKKSLAEWAKSELNARRAPKKTVPCVCTSYPFPHRHKGGKCGSTK